MLIWDGKVREGKVMKASGYKVLKKAEWNFSMNSLIKPPKCSWRFWSTGDGGGGGGEVGVGGGT